MISGSRAVQGVGVLLIVLAAVAAGGAIAVDARSDCTSGEGIYVRHYDESADHTDAPRASVEELPEDQREAFLEALESGSLPTRVEGPHPDVYRRIVPYEGDQYEVTGPIAWDCGSLLGMFGPAMWVALMAGVAVAGVSTAWRRLR